MKRDQVFEFFRRLAEENPSPTTELEYDNPYTLLVAVVLSAQATDASVNIATRPLFKDIKTPRQMVALGEERLREAIKTIGLFNTKARNVIALSQALIDQHGSKVPSTREELEALPGVGRKTANVVLNTAFGQETFAVDTHIFRVSNRTGLAPGKNPLEVELKLEKMDIFLVDPEAESQYPESFEITGPEVILCGKFPMTTRVGYGEKYEALKGKSIAITRENIDAREPKRSSLVVPGLGEALVEDGSSFVVNKIGKGVDAKTPLRGTVTLKLRTAGGQRTVNGTFKVRGTTWG